MAKSRRTSRVEAVHLWTKFGPLELTLNEEQIPQIVEKQQKPRSGMKWLDELFLRPRQVRYQAALRPDMTSRIDSKVLSNFSATLNHDFLASNASI